MPQPQRKIWFTADTHFGHDNIIPMCNRPFMTAADRDVWKNHKQNKESIPSALKLRLEQAGRLMDETLIKNWNDTVAPDDDVWFLGDFHKSNRSSPGDYLRQLNGRLYLIKGNHDTDQCANHSKWVFQRSYAELRTGKDFLIMCHYAMRVWNGSYHGQNIQLHGHSHGKLFPLPMQCDVGVDCWNFRPISLDQIKARITGSGNTP